MHKDPLQTIHKLIQEKYSKAETVFWAGSVSKNQATETSDLDLIVIYKNIPNAYREAFIYDGWPIDVFVHDPSTLEYIFEEIDKVILIAATPKMIAEGIELPHSTELGKKLKQHAQAIIDSSPTISFNDLCSRRFHITDSLGDLESAKNQHEKMAISFELYKKLAEFYLLPNNKWIGSGKQLARLLEEYNRLIANKFELAFSKFDKTAITNLSIEILKPHGGLLWDGFKNDAPKEHRTK